MTGCSYDTLVRFMICKEHAAFECWSTAIIDDEYGNRDYKSCPEFRRIQDLFVLAQEVLDELGS